MHIIWEFPPLFTALKTLMKPTSIKQENTDLYVNSLCAPLLWLMLFMFILLLTLFACMCLYCIGRHSITIMRLLMAV